MDFSKMSNADIRIALMGYENEYNVKKGKIIEMVRELEELDRLYRKGSEELEKRGFLSD